MTVATKPGRRGEREVSRKTIARGMPGDFRCDRGDYARVLCFISHARLRVHQAPGIPCALYWAKVSCTTRAPRAAGSRRFVLSANAPHSQPSSPGLTGRSSIPETAVIGPRSRGVLDTPLEPVIGLAEGETR